MDTAEIWVAVLTAGGGGAILTGLANGLVKYFNGSAGREKGRNADLKAQRDDLYQRLLDAQHAADVESRRRRLAQEHAAGLRSMLLEHGVPLAELPPWPTEHPSQLPERPAP